MNLAPRLSEAFRRKPIRTVALLLVAGVVFAILREFAAGFFDGLTAALNDGR